jgi:nickel/cobalt exporter
MEWIFDSQRWLYSGAIEILRDLGNAGGGSFPALFATGFLFGLLHAFLPGHGKVLLSTYYAGGGQWRAAIGSSVVLIATHVGSAIVIVLGGLAIIQRTIGGAGRAPTLELASHIFVALIGSWLLLKALRSHEHDHEPRSGFALAIGAGLVPCPLTAFMLTFAVAKGLLGAGLILSASFALGMIVTVSLFPLLTLAARHRLVPLISASEGWRATIMRALEIAAAGGIIALGIVPILLE